MRSSTVWSSICVEFDLIHNMQLYDIYFYRLHHSNFLNNNLIWWKFREIIEIIANSMMKRNWLQNLFIYLFLRNITISLLLTSLRFPLKKNYRCDTFTQHLYYRRRTTFIVVRPPETRSSISDDSYDSREPVVSSLNCCIIRHRTQRQIR